MAANPFFVESVLSAYLATAPVFKALLVDSTYEPDMGTEGVGTATVVTHEIPGVDRVDLTSVQTFMDVESGEVCLKCDDIVFPLLDEGVTDVGGVVIINENADQIVAWDLDEGPFDPPAGDLTYTVDPTSGFVLLTV